MMQFVKTFYRDYSLKKKLIIVYTTFTLFIVLLVGISTYNLSIRRLENNEKAFITNKLDSTVFVLDSILDSYVIKSDSIFSNILIQRALTRNYEKKNVLHVLDAYQNEIYKTIDPIMDDVIERKYSNNSYVLLNSKVKIYTMNSTFPIDGGIVREYNKIANEEWVKSTEKENGRIKWRGLFLDQGKEFISVNRVHKDFKSLKPIGILSILIPKSKIIDLISLSDNEKLMDIYLFDDEDNFISSRNNNINLEDAQVLLPRIKDKDIGDSIIDFGGEKYIVVNNVSRVTGWHMIGIYPYRQITQSMSSIKDATLFILIIAIVSSILITIVMSNVITKRLSKIMKKMAIIKEDRYEKIDPIEGKDEIGQLDNMFNSLIKEINNHVETEMTLQTESSRLKLELLQANINPHIIYNTLATIRWKAKEIGAKDIDNVVEQLTGFFKYHLNKGMVIATIKQELDLIKCYIQIYKFTYNMDFEENIEIENEVLDYYTLHLIIQPIVENALVHGLRPRKKKGKLSIKVSNDSNDIIFVIEDNGTGMTQEKVLEVLTNAYESSLSGYGLKNVADRIKLYFGTQYGLGIDTQVDIGTRVTVTIPILSKEEHIGKIGDLI
ncbi:histidine kinase [Lachnoclostridium sp.]|uniref:sensor histidine kinase n=1 Tax=Lachnoclostridium sp. TaxID=2028282 RepID=UPI0028985064|nr:histidine kinase [Lachnoclostridium sp.]